MEYALIVTVNEDILKNVSGLDNIHEAIEQEAGWLADSGIYVREIKEGSKNNE